MMKIRAGEVMGDIRSAAWLESELHPELDRHRRHEMADICEEGNIERVWRVLGIKVSEVRIALQTLLVPEKDLLHVNELEAPESWEFQFMFPLQEITLSYLKEKIHEYLVAAVMEDRTSVIIPEASAVWRRRAEEALSALRMAAATVQKPFCRVRRPLWPL